MTQGPIGRYNELQKQLTEEKNFSFENMKDGIQLLLGGYLKKLVIADRASIVVNTVIGNYTNYGGGIILISMILYCIQLYCDFSGGIDIVRGVAKMFGVEMAVNFKRPIFSTSLAEFWRRWHITLGSWLKDYLFYPLSLSKPFIKLGKKIRSKISGKAGKIIPLSLATFIVYFVIGIWHGASVKYIIFGLWNGIIITSSLLIESAIKKPKVEEKLPSKKIHKTKETIKNILRIIRTAIIVLIGRYITRAGRFLASIEMLKITVFNFVPKQLVDGSLLNLGITTVDYIVIIIGTIIMLILEGIEEFGKETPKEKLEKKPAVVQWAILMATLLILLIFGICRGNYISSEFIYKNY